MDWDWSRVGSLGYPIGYKSPWFRHVGNDGRLWVVRQEVIEWDEGQQVIFVVFAKRFPWTGSVHSSGVPWDEVRYPWTSRRV